MTREQSPARGTDGLSDQSKGMRAEVGDLARERCRALGIDRLETDSYKQPRTGRVVKGTKESWAQCGPGMGNVNF